MVNSDHFKQQTFFWPNNVSNKSIKCKNGKNLLYLGVNTELWRKFSNTLLRARSSASTFWASLLLGQGQHWPFSPPATSDLVGLVSSSTSDRAVAEMRIGIFSSVGKQSYYYVSTLGLWSRSTHGQRRRRLTHDEQQMEDSL